MRFVLFLDRCLAIDFSDSLLCIFREPVTRIALEEILENCPGLRWIVQVVLIDLANREQRIAAMLAAGMLAAQEFILGDGLLKDGVIVKAAARFGQRLGYGYRARISFGG